MKQSEMEDKVLGMLVGAGLGDALGAPHEFRYQTDVYTGILEYKGRINSMYQPCVYLDVGQVTDDTEMTLTIARQIVEKGYNKDEIVLEYMKWANSKTRMMGRNTRQLFKGVKTLRGYKNRFEKNEKISESNGALMRCSALSLLPDDSYIDDCKLTNPAPQAVEVNRVYIGMLRQIFKGVEKSDLKLDSSFPDVQTAIEQALSKQTRDVTGKTKGWCVHGLYCAIYSLLHFDNYKDAIDWVIRLGGDTDTNGCISGAVLGAYYGYTEVEKVEGENIEILLSCDTTGGDLVRDERYRMTDVKTLAHNLTCTVVATELDSAKI